MIEQVLNNHKIVFYDSIEDLPISQFHKYSKFLLVESGIGDTIDDIDNHISRVIKFLGDTKKAHQELLNMRQNIFMVANEVDLHNKAVLCLIKKIDGKEWTDFSDSGIEKLYEEVNGATLKDFNLVKQSVVAKIDGELKVYFPEIFETSVEKNQADLLRKRAILQLSEIIDKQDHKAEIEKITTQLFGKETPKCFEGKDSEEIRFDKQFEDMCLAMSREFGGMVKGYTTMEFYSAYVRLEKENEERKKTLKKKK